MTGPDSPRVLGGLVLMSPLSLAGAEPVEAQTVCSPDGSGGARLRLASRAAGTETFVVHAEASYAAARARAECGESLATLRARLAEPIAVTEIAMALGRMNCETAAQNLVEEIFRGDREALARLSPDPVGDGVAGVRQLDAGLLAALVLAGRSERLGMPAACGSLAIDGPSETIRWCHASRRDGAATFDLRMFDGDGQTVARFEALEFRPRVAERTAGAVALYGWRWVPPDDSGRRLADALEARARTLCAKGLAALGWRPGDGAESAGRLGVASGQERLFARLARHARSDGAGSAPVAQQFPEAAAESALLERCGQALPDVLTGRRAGLDVIVPDAGFDGLLRLYRDGPSFAPAQRGVARAVADLVRARGGEPARVLEIGAGTGATSTAVIEALGDQPASYVFTDVSRPFLSEAERRLSDPRLSFRLLDLERDTASQGFSEPFDVVIAANVVHALPDLRAGLRSAASLTRPDGALVLLEGTTRRLWIDLIFGLLPGWWRFSDADLRPDHALLDAEDWPSVLRECGFGHVGLEPVGEGDEAFPQTVIVARRSAPMKEKLPWLVVSGESEAGRDLARRLVEAGAPCEIARDEGEASAMLSERGAGTIVDLTGLAPAAVGSPTALLAEIGPRRLDLLQRLATLDPPPRRLAVVSAGAVAIDDNEAARPDLACLDGLAMTFARETAGVALNLIDADAESLADPDFPSRLIRLLRDDRRPEWRVAWRAGRPHRARLGQIEATPGNAHSFAGRTQLVAGAGALGEALARRLVARGATHVAIASRTAPARAMPLADDLRAGGATVVVHAADLSDRGQAENLFAALDGDLPPLGGVFLTAGAHDDGLIGGQTWPRIETALAPKLAGAWNLHELTLGRPLDRFVLFSSAFSLFGAPGLAGYVAANAGLDALAALRRSMGLPTLSVNWGPWAGDGMIAAGRRGGGAEWTRQGLAPMSAEDGLDALDRLLAMPVGQAAALDADWGRFAGAFAGPVPAALDDLLRGAEAPQPAPAVKARKDRRAEMAILPERRRREALAEHLATLVAGVLGVETPSAIDRSQGFFAQGMDSLATLDLRSRIGTSLGCRIEPVTLFRYGNVSDLAGFLDRELFAQAEARP